MKLKNRDKNIPIFYLFNSNRFRKIPRFVNVVSSGFGAEAGCQLKQAYGAERSEQRSAVRNGKDMIGYFTEFKVIVGGDGNDLCSSALYFFRGNRHFIVKIRLSCEHNYRCSFLYKGNSTVFQFARRVILAVDI